MRIIAGEWRGRVIAAPPGRAVRPTRDRVREAWMSIVHPALPGARVADLCCGSGALGLEALSRGATQAEFVDDTPASLAALRRNLERLGAAPRSTVHRADAVRFVSALPERAFDVVFADPPYASDIAVRLARRWLDVPYARILGIEHAAAVEMPPGGETRRYGSSGITFYRAE